MDRPGLNTRAALGWALFLIVGGGADYLLDRRHNGSTFSECNRALCRVETVGGRLAFTTGLTAGAFWYWRHICR